MAYRLGLLRADDPEVGPLELQGDGFAAAGEPVTLIVAPAVQRWLGLNADEAAGAERIVEEYRQAMKAAYATGEWLPPHRHPGARSARRAAETHLESLLGPQRSGRLERLSWRLRDADALLDDEVAASLGLSAEQRQALLAALDANEAGRSRLSAEISAVRLQSAADLQKLAQRYEREGAERLLAVLTPEQRAAFEKLKSRPAVE